MKLFRSFFLVMLAVLAKPVLAQEETFGVWRYSCDGGPCQIYFSVKAPESDETLVSMAVLHDPRNDSGSLMVEVPSLVALPPGLRLDVGSTQKDIPYQFCRPEGCVAILVLDQDVLENLSNATMAGVTFIRYGRTEPELYEVPANGFSEAYARLKAGN